MLKQPLTTWAELSLHLLLLKCSWLIRLAAEDGYVSNLIAGSHFPGGNTVSSCKKLSRPFKRQSLVCAVYATL